ncbi:membrane protein [Sorangium cellulosum]|uniref:Membrane protein n=1 Tax=Sorangium cellulosum TaxID=56 RepID=A0A4V0NDF7_SORCE|nr:NfeD family protein [Sorangium cellulosum]AUX22512.1 membrane protein [Sorangium cellulosum]
MSLTRGRLRARLSRWIAYALALASALLALASSARAGAAPTVHVAPIQGEINAGLSAFVERAIAEAEEAGASALILPINTLGGRVDAAIVLRDALLATPLRTVALVDPRAISAGALLALAAERILMAEGATLGAAAPVLAGPEGAEPAGEKATSYVRKEFRATAERRGRPPELAEAMVDEDVVVEGVVGPGKLLTLTTAEALELGVADARADDLGAALSWLGLEGAEIRHASPSWAERALRFLTQPVVSSLLLSLGIMGLLVELRTPGFGIPGLVGAACLVLFFWAQWLLALVGWEEIALAALGAVLLALEVLVIPGFGVAGIAGAVALIAGLSLSLVGAGVTPERAVEAVAQVALSLALALAGALVALRFLPRVPAARRLILATSLGPDVAPGGPARATGPRVGERGLATTPLRPAGIARLGGARVDVVSEAEYIGPGEAVEVIRVEGNRVVVRRAAPDGEGG